MAIVKELTNTFERHMHESNAANDLRSSLVTTAELPEICIPLHHGLKSTLLIVSIARLSPFLRTLRHNSVSFSSSSPVSK